MYRAFLLLLCIATMQSNGQKFPVTVFKCCGKNEYVNTTEDNVSCASNKNAVPKIYSPGSKRFLNSVPDTWNIKSTTIPDCGTYRLEVVQSANVPNFLIFEDGSLYLVETNRHISPDKYCFASNNTALYCTNDKVQVTVKKCCGKGAVFSETKSSCISMNVTDYKIDVGDDKLLVEGFPHCENYIIAGKLHEVDLFANGSVHLSRLKTVLPKGTFCLEHVLENASGSASIIACDAHIPTTTPHPTIECTLCVNDVRLKLYAAALLLSAVFLAATLIAGFALPVVHHHALHWRCQTNHVACLLVGDVLLAVTQLAGKDVVPFVCVSLAIIMHFSFLAAFFWLNTMCFNIWWTFRDLRPGTLEKRQERCRLRIYGVYAWGVPFVISMIALILDTVPEGPDYTFLRPRFGDITCWFPGDMEILTYFFGPIGILLLINLFLFAATARELTCGLWKRELVKSTTERAALGRVCMKLVVVMGVTWIADVLSWAVGGPQALWYITDLINALQGVFIFIVVACQPQVWSALKRLWCRRQSLAADITGNGNHHSSSSHGLPSYGDSVTNHSVSNTTKSVPIETSC